MEKDYSGKKIYTDKEYMGVVQSISRCQSRLKDWSIKLMKLDAAIYVGTEIVDRDKLYKIDHDGFNREVLKILPKNNNDLFDNNPSPTKSAKKSPGKKKKGKKGKGNDNEEADFKSQVHSVSFIK
jgi:hypothetical protein